MKQSVDTFTDCGDGVHCLSNTSIKVETSALLNSLPEFLVVHWLSSLGKPEPYFWELEEK